MNRLRSCRWSAGWLTLLFMCCTLPALVEDFDRVQARLLREIEADVAMTSDQLGRRTLDARLRRALAEVPRHEFVPPEQREHAYENRPLAIGYGQTISQPYIVAIMTELLALEPDAVVFELGTGSGYQAAVLARLVRQVYTMEIVKPLAERAQATLARLGYHNVQVRIGDGYHGWPEQAPFDAIIVTAAGDHIPPPLLQQLKPGGRLILPVGSSFLTQQLVLVEKGKDGSIRSREVLPVRFVPITGQH